MFDDLRRELTGCLKVVGREAVLEVLRESAILEPEDLRRHLESRLGVVWEDRWAKAPTRKRPPKTPRAYIRGGHSSVDKILRGVHREVRLAASRSLARAIRPATVPVGTPTLKGHTDRITGMLFSPDGKRVLSGSHDKTARIWDAQTGQQKATLRGHTGWIFELAFSADGRRVLTGSQDHTARVWDATAGPER